MSRQYDARVYDWDETDTGDYAAAYGKAREWDYNNDARIGLGVMYRHDAPLFEESYPVPNPSRLKRNWHGSGRLWMSGGEYHLILQGR